MQMPPYIINAKRLLTWINVGQSIRNLYVVRSPQDDPFETRTKPTEPAEVIIGRIKIQTTQLQKFILADPSMREIRKLFGVKQAEIPKPELLQLLSLVIYNDFCMKDSGETPDSVSYVAGPLFSSDILHGRLLARSITAELIDRQLVVIGERNIRASSAVHTCLIGNNVLLEPGLNEAMVRNHFFAKSQAVRKAQAEKAGTTETKQPAVITPQSLYDQLRQIVIGQDQACRVLATRGWLHMKRVEMLKQGKRVGSNECLFFISQHSGVGKTWLAESYGKLCSFPYTSFDSCGTSSVGYCGLDIVEDSIKSLLRSVPGDPTDKSTIEKARLGGIIFYDEFTKKRAFTDHNGRDISGASVQAEVLRLMEGCSKIIIGNRRVERDTNPIEIDASGLMLLFGGFVDNSFDKIIAKIQGQGSIGFKESAAKGNKDAYLQDALVSYGFLPEFVNRLTKIVIFRKLSPDDLVAIANSPYGVIASYRQLLGPHGMNFLINPEALRCIAGVAVETGMMARGLRLIIGALVEELVFSGTQGEVVLTLKEVKQAIEQVVSLESVGG
jgi:ATP-dependent Clp protease ATP-binding subunit ClpX